MGVGGGCGARGLVMAKQAGDQPWATSPGPQGPQVSRDWQTPQPCVITGLLMRRVQVAPFLFCSQIVLIVNDAFGTRFCIKAPFNFFQHLIFAPSLQSPLKKVIREYRKSSTSFIRFALLQSDF